MARPPTAAAAPGTGRRLRADAARNAELLLRAARELFDERGPEVPLDEIARRAGVGNATLYRNFPSRGDLLIAVYSDEVDELCAQGAALLDASAPEDGLYAWLDLFAEHVASRRPLAEAAIAQEPAERRGQSARHWHARMRATTAAHLARAREAGTVRPELTPVDLLSLTSAAALASTDPADAVRLIRVMRHGIEPAGSG
ncbi:putative tetR-family transcriptional regulator [Frankia sp. AiPs1]|uniref:TetR/AcrR family transcriptional regulator n=1 Tax=Frankia sp. AiPa1 TaxID=573492 RepID=UPI00202B01E2|nr:TetR/AcrR family transcriptional regulator [Frankia sp. AiPa1]MCL9759800.1 TetR/AcrR family transcriptional regulator [Frankia sp. AiPa1]